MPESSKSSDGNFTLSCTLILPTFPSSGLRPAAVSPGDSHIAAVMRHWTAFLASIGCGTLLAAHKAGSGDLWQARQQPRRQKANGTDNGQYSGGDKIYCRANTCCLANTGGTNNAQDQDRATPGDNPDTASHCCAGDAGRLPIVSGQQRPCPAKNRIARGLHSGRHLAARFGGERGGYLREERSRRDLHQISEPDKSARDAGKAVRPRTVDGARPAQCGGERIEYRGGGRRNARNLGQQVLPGYGAPRQRHQFG